MPTSAAELLRNTRWMACLTQAEVAARAGVPRAIRVTFALQRAVRLVEEARA